MVNKVLLFLSSWIALVSLSAKAEIPMPPPLIGGATQITTVTQVRAVALGGIAYYPTPVYAPVNHGLLGVNTMAYQPYGLGYGGYPGYGYGGYPGYGYGGGFGFGFAAGGFGRPCFGCRPPGFRRPFAFNFGFNSFGPGGGFGFGFGFRNF